MLLPMFNSTHLYLYNSGAQSSKLESEDCKEKKKKNLSNFCTFRDTVTETESVKDLVISMINNFLSMAECYLPGLFFIIFGCLCPVIASYTLDGCIQQHLCMKANVLSPSCSLQLF